MDTDAPDDPEAAFAALLHRLASPLGAIANYAYLLPENDAQGAREGILTAMTSVRGTLLEGQAWLDALATAREEVPDGGVDFAGALHAAADDQGTIAVTTAAQPPIAVPHAAATRLATAVVADAAAAGASALRVDVAAEDAVHLVIEVVGRAWSEAEATQAFDLFRPRDPGSNDTQSELAVVGSLARRLGGRAWGAVGPGGEAVLHLVLPATTADDNHEEQMDP